MTDRLTLITKVLPPTRGDDVRTLDESQTAARFDRFVTGDLVRISAHGGAVWIVTGGDAEPAPRTVGDPLSSAWVDFEIISEAPLWVVVDDAATPAYVTVRRTGRIPSCA